MITVAVNGDFSNTTNFFKKIMEASRLKTLEKYGEMGVRALSAATPVDTGKTANSWGYTIEQSDGMTAIHWTNSNVNKGVNIALILQYGHGTKNGGYVAGRDYINPAMQPLFDQIADMAWKEVSNK
jgi:hypothetical protein